LEVEQKNGRRFVGAVRLTGIDGIFIYMIWFYPIALLARMPDDARCEITKKLEDLRIAILPGLVN
jgi:hypothetical protein